MANHPQDLPPLPSPPYGPRTIDWRTLDPALIQGEGVSIEALRTYREKFEELLERAEGKYVLISGREIVAFYDDLESAAKGADEHRGSGRILVKKVAAIEPIHTLGGVIG